VADREPRQVELHLAYCAWLLLQPASIARYNAPALPAWVQLFVDVVHEAPEPWDDDTPGQHYRRAIIAGATPEQPFPGEVRAKALAVEALVRGMSVARLRAIGGPGAVCRALGATPRARAKEAPWERELARITPAKEAVA
jgi:hypothetical protein